MEQRAPIAGCRARPVALSVAPMMDRTDRHHRTLLRLLSRHTLLYTEMVTTGALIHGDRERLLAYAPEERPLVLQLGGDDPVQLARCAAMAEDRGFSEVNLNVGCPSERVQKGRFGVCLMALPELVAECVAAMRAACSLPVTVKHRIGFDDLDRYEDMRHFVDVVAQAGCDRFVVHARKAWLKGLSPKDNRNIPPLRYQDVYRLKRERPDLLVELNGGVTSLAEARAHLEHVDGVMIGRASWDDPWLFAEADAVIFGDAPRPRSRGEVVRAMLPYIEDMVYAGSLLLPVVRCLLMLYKGQPGGRQWRRHLGEHARAESAGVEVVAQALALMEPEPPA